MNQQPQQFQEIHLQDYLQVLFRRKWTAITFFVILVTVVTIGTFRMKPVYRATATLLIEKEYTTVPYQEGIAIDISQQDYYLSQYKIMKSRTLSKEVIEELQLEKLPEFSNSKDIVSLFLKKIVVEPERNTRLVKICAESYSPALSMKIANKLSELYIKQNLENRLFASREILKKLPEKAIESLSVSEEFIESLPSVVNHPLIQQLKSEYIKLETEYADLSKRYKEKHPQMTRIKAALDNLKEKIQQEIKNIVESIKVELSGALKTNNVRIIDPAEIPKSPVRPKKNLNIVLSVIVGLFGGIMLSFFFEYMDNTIKTQQDIEKYLQVAFLGFVPKIKAKKEEDRKLFVITEPKSISTESIKSLRSNICFSLPKKKLKTILITSAGPGEGKTLITVNLAISFAQIGEETLLVDCDLRHSSLHKIFKLRNGKGITNFLIGESDIENIIQKTDIEHLSVVTSGPHTPNPAELLNSAKLKEFIDEHKQKFSRIIFDSCPVVPLSDVINLSAVVDGIIQVVRYGKQNRQMVLRAKQLISSNNTKIIGAILNDVGIEAVGYYYRYPYKYYRHYTKSNT